MSEWHKYEVAGFPCMGCQFGYSNISSEMRSGELWVKSDDCSETCLLLKNWRRRQELERDMAERE